MRFDHGTIDPLWQNERRTIELNAEIWRNHECGASELLHREERGVWVLLK